jgi:hypothetical protein
VSGPGAGVVAGDVGGVDDLFEGVPSHLAGLGADEGEGLLPPVEHEIVERQQDRRPFLDRCRRPAALGRPSARHRLGHLGRGGPRDPAERFAGGRGGDLDCAAVGASGGPAGEAFEEGGVGWPG